MAKSAKKSAPVKSATSSNTKPSPKAASPKKSAGQSSTNSSGDVEPMLEKLFHDELKDIYYAEKLLVKTLPKMRKAATSPALASAFEDHLAVTKEQVSRLEQVFELLGKKAQAKKCDAMEGLVKEGASIIEDTETGSKTRDVGLILAAQKVEHYEIATYGCLAQIAKTMGLEEIKNLLGATLDEEKEADTLLTRIAENNINSEAEQEGEES